MGLKQFTYFAKFGAMKRMMILAIVALMASACNNGAEPETPNVIKADENPDAIAVDPDADTEPKPIFREEEPEGGWPNGLPPTLAACVNKQYKYQKKIDSGMRYLEMQFFADHLLLKNQQNQPFWNRFDFDLHGDTIFPQRKNEQTGEMEGTGDFFIIHRVWGDELSVTSYDQADPTQRSEIPFKRVPFVADTKDKGK